MIGDYVGTGFGCGYIYMNDKYASYKTTSNMYNGALIREKIEEDKFGYNGYMDLGLMMRIRPSDKLSFGINYYGQAYANNLLSSNFGFMGTTVGGFWAGYEKYFFKIGKSISEKGDYKYFNLELKGRLNDEATSPYLGVSYNRFALADGTGSYVQTTTYNSVSLQVGIVWF